MFSEDPLRILNDRIWNVYTQEVKLVGWSYPNIGKWSKCTGVNSVTVLITHTNYVDFHLELQLSDEVLFLEIAVKLVAMRRIWTSPYSLFKGWYLSPGINV
jgi:hypothetical protein